MQEALPREMYVDDAAWVAEREAVLFGEWFCVGRRDALGLAAPAQVVVLDVAGESVLVTSDAQGDLHASYNVCRHRGSQLLRGRHRLCCRSACVVRTTHGPTGSTAGC